MRLLVNDSFKWKNEMIEACKIIKKFFGNKDITIECIGSKGVQTHGYCKFPTEDTSTCIIAISNSLIKTEDVIGTCIHELLHAYFPYDGHTGNWLLGAKKISQNTPYNIQRCSNKEHSNVNYKYSIYCSCCKRLIDRRLRACNLTKNPSVYRSSCCKSPLEVIQNY